MAEGIELDSCKDSIKIDYKLPYICVNCYRASECRQCDDKGNPLMKFVQVQKCHDCGKEMMQVEKLGIKDYSTGEYGWIEWYFCANKECKLEMDSSRFRRMIK